MCQLGWMYLPQAVQPTQGHHDVFGWQHGCAWAYQLLRVNLFSACRAVHDEQVEGCAATWVFQTYREVVTAVTAEL
jgi:hypothetical protein